MRIVCMSDTHLRHNFAVPDGDVLIHAGDGTGSGHWKEVAKWLNWVAAFPHAQKIVVAGNHDWLFERTPELVPSLIPAGVISMYRTRCVLPFADAFGHGASLQDAGAEIDGVRFWGSPWQPEFHDWAFNLPRGKALAKRWDLIPRDTDVLITHGPPHGIFDQLPAPDSRNVGCEDLLNRLADLPRLRLHIFGHIHDAYGQVTRGGVQFVNACICNEDYLACRAPVVVDL